MEKHKQMSPLVKTTVRRSYSDITDEFISKMLFNSQFNSVEWVRFKDIQIDDFIKMTKEYLHESDGNHYLYRNVRYTMKASIKRCLINKGCKINGKDYKIGRFLL
jgi:hypothetical protein